MNVPPEIYSAVSPIASANGVPDPLWKTVAFVESSFNPNAYNASGAYGLFQLLYPGGQGENAIRAGYSQKDLFDPRVNAQYGMPAISSAWNNLKNTFDANSLDWWREFAIESGHPGGSLGNPETEQTARLLMQAYKEFAGSSTPGQNGGIVTIPTSAHKIGIFFIGLTLIVLGFVGVVKK